MACAPTLKDLEKFVRSDQKQLLGEGGMGKVYKVGSVPCYYAAKVPKENPNNPGRNQELLTIEGTFLEQIKDKCSKYFQCFTNAFIIDKEYWLVTEYIDFPDLFTCMDMKIEITPKAVRNLIEGLETLHRLGIAHLDIKPENIHFNNKTNQIKYIDFGLACGGRGNVECKSRGTALYAPVDILNVTSLALAQESDLWSLGVTIYVWIYDRIPNIHDWNEARYNEFQKQIDDRKLNIDIRLLMKYRQINCFKRNK
jgi:serine/threonine protein kinase